MKKLLKLNNTLFKRYFVISQMLFDSAVHLQWDIVWFFYLKLLEIVSQLESFIYDIKDYF